MRFFILKFYSKNIAITFHLHHYHRATEVLDPLQSILVPFLGMQFLLLERQMTILASSEQTFSLTHLLKVNLKEVHVCNTLERWFIKCGQLYPPSFNLAAALTEAAVKLLGLWLEHRRWELADKSRLRASSSMDSFTATPTWASQKKAGLILPAMGNTLQMATQTTPNLFEHRSHLVERLDRMDHASDSLPI